MIGLKSSTIGLFFAVLMACFDCSGSCDGHTHHQIGSLADTCLSSGVRVEIVRHASGRTTATMATEGDPSRLPLFHGPIWYECASCGYIYDASEGDPSNGVLPGTQVRDLPEDWVCPVCEVGKDALRPIDQ